MDRRPPAKMESRDERVTIRLTPTQREMFEEAARAIGEELSRYIRGCAVMGHTIKQAQSLLKATGG
jgi:uncharacterized protein (DUF1778 family)